MAKIKIYIASSLDGYIARKDDSIDWLEKMGGEDEDYGYNDFIENVGACIMGARTYSECLKHPDRFMDGMMTYVVSHQLMPIDETRKIEFINGNLKASMDRIRKSTSKDIWLVGGGKLIASFLNENLVDEILQFVAPVLLREGIPLYPGLKRETSLQILDSKKYKSGMVRLHYALSSTPVAG